MSHAPLFARTPAYSLSQTSPANEASASNRQHSFYPYTNNGGSTLGITGADFTILAGDTRSANGYSINTRFEPKLFRIGNEDDSRIVLSVVGYAADGKALQERLNAVVNMYRYQHGRAISVNACAQRLSTILYEKRFFPYQVQAILGGLDEEGRGALYSYDPAGTCERSSSRAAGVAANLIMPFLDSQVYFNNQHIPGSGDGLTVQRRPVEPLAQKVAVDLVKDAFTTATERHIELGDGLQIMVITKDGIEETFTQLKKD